MASKWKWTRIGEYARGEKGERVIEECQSRTGLARFTGEIVGDLISLEDT